MSISKTTVASPGRFQKVTERVRLSVMAVKIGMRVVELDRPWTETPFLFQGFVIESMEHIDELRQFTSVLTLTFRVLR